MVSRVLGAMTEAYDCQTMTVVVSQTIVEWRFGVRLMFGRSRVSSLRETTILRDK